MDERQVTHNDIFLMLGRLEGKVDALLSNQDRQDKTLKEHDERISKLERFVSRAAGIAAAISFLVGGSVAALTKLFSV